MKTNRLNLILLTAFLIVLLIVAGSGWFLFNFVMEADQENKNQSEEETRAFKEPVEFLSIKSIAGSIRVESWKGEGVEVRYRKQGPPGALEKLEVRMEQEGNELRIWTEFSPFSLGNAGRVDYDIWIPPGVDTVKAASVSGEIRIEGAEANQILESVSGRIMTNDSRSLDINSVSGSLEFRSRGPVSAETVSGRINGTIEEGPEAPSVQIKSISGSISLDLPESWTGDVQMSSVSGSLNSTLPVIIEEQSRTGLTGRLGENGGQLKLKTTSGSISIE